MTIIEKVKNEKILNPEDKIVILLGRTPKDQTVWVGIKKIE